MSISSLTEINIGTVDDVSTLTKMKRSTIYQLAREKRIDGVIRIGRALRFDMKKVGAWLQQGGSVSEI